MMQDPASAAAFTGIKPQFPEQEQHLKCPRCDSTNTKFCYYNNYNLSQPRHFCKSCRRYWTKGGALRNIPVGGGTRKNSKRPTSTGTDTTVPTPTASSKRSAPSTSTTASPVKDHRSPFHLPKVEPLGTLYPMAGVASSGDQASQMVDVGGSFSSLLSTNGHYMSLLEGLHHGGGHGAFTLPSSIANSDPDPPNSAPPPPPPPPESNNFWNSDGDGGGAGDAGGWPDLSIYTPGSRFP